MEIAKNVRDFLVGMKEALSPEEDQLLSSLQTLHEEYLNIMENFLAELNSSALTVSPEARMVAHNLRLKIYQDWRAKLMERVFDNSIENVSAEDAESHEDGCDCCFCELKQRLRMYESVMADYFAASTKIKSPENDSSEDSVFKMPEFLTT
ncbi:hypothetical protein V7S43_011672 [Phytophthora oleae]|uniref:Uncharacterized protein n=1 Tax=Phytophthora oleae TaxID=2107226 RepID=A0ABD3F942_9STRA|nr:hypothetical protein DVH05_017070 [Phytophthora capsici]|eukprot:jgi/Phyca11/502583/fgenesh2_kg.PHYCAscaffold_1_\